MPSSGSDFGVKLHKLQASLIYVGAAPGAANGNRLKSSLCRAEHKRAIPFVPNNAGHQ